MKRSSLVLALLISSIAIAGEKHLATPPLSLVARSLIHEQMAGHSKQMTELVWAVVLLDYRETVALAKALAAEPRIARPTAAKDATELSAALPPRFFTLQDQLRTRAHKLEVAAEIHDAAAVAQSYGAVAETCVACHDAYLSQR